MTYPNKRISLAVAALLLTPLACSSQGSTKTTAFSLAPATTLAIAEYPHTDIHFASDISAATQDRVRMTVSMAEKFWGVVDSLEMWVVGLSTKAAMALKEDFCQQRKVTNTPSDYTCGPSIYEMRTQFWKFANNSIYVSKDRHEYRETSGFVRFEHQGGYIMMVYPFGLSGKWYDEVKYDQEVIFHEYFHAIQRMYENHPQAEPDHPDKFDGPDWMTEGLAVYMSEYAVGLLRSIGELEHMRKPIYETEEEYRSYAAINASLMAKLNNIEDIKKDHPGMSLKTSGSSWESNAPYIYGAWAAAYLSHIAGKEAFIDKYYPAIDSVGWKQAFKQAFGMSIEDFYIEFDQFMKQPAEVLEDFLDS